MPSPASRSGILRRLVRQERHVEPQPGRERETDGRRPLVLEVESELPDREIGPWALGSERARQVPLVVERQALVQGVQALEEPRALVRRTEGAQQLQQLVVHTEREPVGAPLEPQVIGQLPDRLCRLETAAPEAAGDDVARVGNDIHTGEFDLGDAGVALVDARQEQLIGPAAPEGGAPVEPGGVDRERNVEPVRREADESVIVPPLEALTGMEPVVGDLQPAVHPELYGHLPEHATAWQAVGPGLEVSRIDAVHVPQDVAEPDHTAISDSDPSRVCPACGVGAGRGNRLGLALAADAGVEEEGDSIPHDRPAQAQAGLTLGEIGGPTPAQVAPGQALILEIPVGHAFQRVRPGLGDRVHQSTREPAVAHVERRGHDLDFLQALQRGDGQVRKARDRAVAGLVGVEEVVVGGAVHLQPVQSVGLPGEGEREAPEVDLRGEPRQVRVVAGRGQSQDCGVGDDLGRTRAAGVDEWIHGCLDRDLGQLDGCMMESEAGAVSLPQGKENAVLLPGREPDGMNLDAIRAAHGEMLDEEPAIRPGGRLPAFAG